MTASSIARRTRGVPARPYFSPIHLQPFYRERSDFRAGDFPVTERVAALDARAAILQPPADDQAERVVAALVECAHDQGVA